MNIFALDKCPVQSALWHVDAHVGKMMMEANQMLSAAQYHGIMAEFGIDSASVPQSQWRDVVEGIIFIPSGWAKPTHVNHPCSKWARQSKSNYQWLLALSEALSALWFLSKGVLHGTANRLTDLRVVPSALPDVGLTPFAQAIDDDCFVSADAVENYRHYYAIKKRHIHRWSTGVRPPWI